MTYPAFAPGVPGNQFDSLSGYGGSLGTGGYNTFASPVQTPAASYSFGQTAPTTPSFMQAGFSPSGGAPVSPGGSGMFSGFLNTDKQQGWGAPAMGALSGLASAFMGMKQYGLAKQQLAQSQKEFDTNFAAQKGLTNANLQDRQAARVASNPGAYQSVGAYMAANGVK